MAVKNASSNNNIFMLIDKVLQSYFKNNATRNFRFIFRDNLQGFLPIEILMLILRIKIYPIMTIEEKVNEGIKNAMKAHDKVRLETMRNIKKVILEAKSLPGAGDTLEDAECIKLIQKLAKQGKDAAQIYKEQGREDLYEQESGQVAVLEEFLPKQLTEEELVAALKEIIAEVGAASPRDMGKVMGVATKKLAGVADGKLISAKVKELLA